MFVLTRDEGEQVSDLSVVGYGIKLPDGTAFSVSWPGASYAFSADSAHQAAKLRHAKLRWITGNDESPG